MTPYEMMILFYLIFGYILGRKIPFSTRTVKRLFYSIRRIPYWIVYIVEGGKILDDLMIKKSKSFFINEGYKYSLLIKNKEGQSFTPHIILDGYETVFFNKNNINPLIFKEKDIEPGYNDPEMFATLCGNREIQNSISDSQKLITELKRYIMIAMIVISLAMAGIMWFLMGGMGGGAT